MSGLDSHILVSFINRWIHVASMAVILGGGLLMWAAARRLRSGYDMGLLRLSKQYEWYFWGALGLLTLTGVGNLGNFGSGLPGVITTWGTRLLIKLILVLVLVLFSAVRTWIVTGLSEQSENPLDPRAAGLIQSLYAVTILLTVTILVLAISLSHG